METIRLQIDFDTQYEKFKYLFANDTLEIRNYRNSKKGNSAEDLLTDLATSAVTSGFYAIRHTMGIDKAIRKEIDNAVKDAVINSGGTWTD